MDEEAEGSEPASEFAPAQADLDLATQAEEEPSLLGSSSRTARTRKFLAVMGLLATVAAVAVGWGSYHRAQHRTLRIVSRAPIPATVTVPLPDGPSTLEVPALGDLELVLPEGDYVITVELGDARQTVEAHVRSTWDQFFGTSLFVLNVGGTAVVLWEEAVYSQHGEASGADPQVHFEPFVALHDVDFVDSAFPDSLRLENNERKTRTRASVLTDDPAQLAWRLRGSVPPAELMRFLERHLSLSPSDEELLGAYVGLAQAAPPEALAFLQGGLDELPLNTAWHRNYQDFAQLQQRDVHAEYVARLATRLDDAAMLYLTGRVTPDARAAFELYERALERDGSLARAWLAKGWLLACRGDLASATDCYEKTAELDPEDLAWLYHTPEVAIRVGEDLDAAEGALAQRLLREPTDPQAYQLLLLVRASRGDEEGVRNAQAAMQQGFAGFAASEQLHAYAYTELLALEALGELASYLERLEAYATHNDQAPALGVSALLLDGQVGRAERAVQDFTADPIQPLLLAVDHALRNDAETADGWVQEAVRRCGPNDSLGLLLTSPALSADDLHSVDAPLLDLAALRLVLALRHPDQAAELLDPVEVFCAIETWQARYLRQALERVLAR